MRHALVGRATLEPLQIAVQSVSSMQNVQATRLASNRSAPIHVLVLVDTTPGALQSTTTPSAPVPRVTGETPSLAAPSSPK